MKTTECQQHQKETVMLLYRKAMGLSQKALAQNIGINRQTIIRCESGEREPQLTAAQWKRLCRLIKKQLGPAVMLHFIESDDSPDLSSFDVSEAQAILGEKLKALASKDSFA